MRYLRSIRGEYLRSSGENTFDVRMSTDGIDRHGTIVEPDGILSEFWARTGRPVLFGHDHGSPFTGPPEVESKIGRGLNDPKPVDFARADGSVGRALEGPIEFMPADINPTAGKLKQFVEAGFGRSVSISFKPLEAPVMEDRYGEKQVPVFKRVDLLEVSLVHVPSNTEAAVMRSMMLQPESTPWGFDSDSGRWTFNLAKAYGSTASGHLDLSSEELLAELNRHESSLTAGTGDPPAPPPEGADAGADEVREVLRDWLAAQRLRETFRGYN